MGEYLVLAAFAGMVGLFAEAALARKVAIGGRHTPGEIKATCAAVGCYYNSGPGGYGCTNIEKGKDVTCKNGKCVGIVPRRVPGGSRGVSGFDHTAGRAARIDGRVTTRADPAGRLRDGSLR